MKTGWILGAFWVWTLFFISPLFAATRYVNVSNATPVAPYTNWGRAATAIQPAIDAAASGDEILVAPGTYLLTGSVVRIPTNKTLTLRSTQSRAAIVDAQGLSAGLEIRSANSVVEGFTFQNGSAVSYGGGVYAMTNCTVRDCLVTGNRAGGAGGIMIYGAALVENCSVVNNRAHSSGGGIVLYNNSRGRINRCDIFNNVASNYGGGVWIQQGGTISNCWIAGNQAMTENGGGIYMASEGTTNQAELVNSVITGNLAAQLGGGVYASGPAGTLSPVINCTIVSNVAGQDGGGVYAWTTRLINDIIYFNTAPTNANLNAHDSVHSCIISNVCTTSNYFWPNLTNAPAFVDADAGDFRLATASFCIDAGTTNGAPGIDIEGNPRPRVGMPGGLSRADIGAYEYGFHFNDIRFTGTNTVQLRWDVQDRGIYRLDAATNGMVNPNWKDVVAYTNPGMLAGQFVVHTQTVAIPPPVPATAEFRLRISHTLF